MPIIGALHFPLERDGAGIPLRATPRKAGTARNRVKLSKSGGVSALNWELTLAWRRHRTDAKQAKIKSFKSSCQHRPWPELIRANLRQRAFGTEHVGNDIYRLNKELPIIHERRNQTLGVDALMF